MSARPHSASCLGKGLDCNATLLKFPGSFEPAVSSVISGLRLCLPSRLATVNESPRSDSNERERQQADREDRGRALGDDRGNPLHATGEVVLLDQLEILLSKFKLVMPFDMVFHCVNYGLNNSMHQMMD